jgi:hypothetical protein
MNMLDLEEDLVRRAFAAYLRSGGVDQPGRGSGVVEYEGRTYVVFTNAKGVLAVFRHRNDGALKRLRRWPAALVA